MLFMLKFASWYYNQRHVAKMVQLAHFRGVTSTVLCHRVVASTVLLSMEVLTFLASFTPYIQADGSRKGFLSQFSTTHESQIS